jgi:hypothetical protein
LLKGYYGDQKKRRGKDEDRNTIFSSVASNRHSTLCEGSDSRLAARTYLDSNGTWPEPSKIHGAKIRKRRHSMLANRTWIVPTTPADEQPMGLSHIDSDSCWCEPVVETDEEGEEVVVHREITWN